MSTKTEQPTQETPASDAPKPSLGQRLMDNMKSGGGDSEPVETEEPNEPTDPNPALETDRDLMPSGDPAEGDSEEGLGVGGEPSGEPQEHSNPWLDQVRGLGFENLETEEEARERLFEAYQQQQAREQEIMQRMRQVAPLVQYGQQYLSLQNDPLFQKTFGQQKPEPEQQPEAWWNPPEYDPRLVEEWQTTQVDPDTGEAFKVWKDGTPANVRASYESYQSYIRDWQHKLVHNPKEAIGQAIRQEFDQLWAARQQEQQQYQTTTTALQRFQQENAEILFQRDPVTNQLTNQLSRDGRIIQHFIQQAEDGGMRDPQLVFDYAMLKYRSEFGQTPGTQPANGTPAPNGGTNGKSHQQRQMDHLRKGAGLPRGVGGIPNSGGSTHPVDVTEPPPRNKNLRIGQQFLAQLKADNVI